MSPSALFGLESSYSDFHAVPWPLTISAFRRRRPLVFPPGPAFALVAAVVVVVVVVVDVVVVVVVVVVDVVVVVTGGGGLTTQNPPQSGEELHRVRQAMSAPGGRGAEELLGALYFVSYLEVPIKTTATKKFF